MGEDPEQLERDIEATRAKLGADIDALEEKINPKKIAHRSVDNAKDKAAGVKDKVVGAAGHAKDAVAEKFSSDDEGGPSPGPVLADEESGLGDKVAGLAGTVKEKTGSLADKAQPLVGTAKDKAAPLVEKARPAAAGAWATVAEQTRRNPVAIGAAAFVVGVLLGR